MSTDDAAAKRQKRAEKRKAKGGKKGGEKGGRKDKNPVRKEARARYMDELRKQGVTKVGLQVKLAQ